MAPKLARAQKPRLVREERTIELLETLPQRGVLVPAYLVAAYWSWWTVFLVVSFVAWQLVPQVRFLAWTTLVLAILAGGGWWAKGFIERRAPRWARVEDA